MIHFFRKIRRQLLRENRFTRYLLYALGEIFLVVVGILIALEVNNMNERNKSRAQLSANLSKINRELKMNIKTLEFQEKVNDTLIEKLKESLIILKSNRSDSLKMLESRIGALGTDYTIQLQMPHSESLMNRMELLNQSTDSLGFYLIGTRYYLNAVAESNRYVHDQYANSIEPYFYNHISYADVALNQHKNYLIEGGPKTDFTALDDNMYLWNLITFKLETVSAQRDLIRNILGLFEQFLQYLNETSEA